MWTSIKRLELSTESICHPLKDAHHYFAKNLHRLKSGTAYLCMNSRILKMWFKSLNASFSDGITTPMMFALILFDVLLLRALNAATSPLLFNFHFDDAPSSWLPMIFSMNAIKDAACVRTMVLKNIVLRAANAEQYDNTWPLKNLSDKIIPPSKAALHLTLVGIAAAFLTMWTMAFEGHVFCTK